jgi:hypothetical protein
MGIIVSIVALFVSSKNCFREWQVYGRQPLLEGRPFRSRAGDYSHSHLIDDLRTCGSSLHQTIVPLHSWIDED